MLATAAQIIVKCRAPHRSSARTVAVYLCGEVCYANIAGRRPCSTVGWCAPLSREPRAPRRCSSTYSVDKLPRNWLHEPTRASALCAKVRILRERDQGSCAHFSRGSRNPAPPVPPEAHHGHRLPRTHGVSLRARTPPALPLMLPERAGRKSLPFKSLEALI